MSRRPPVSASASACVRATSIRSGTHACRAMRVGRSERSIVIMASLCFRTRTHIFLGKSRNTYIRCALTPASCGAGRRVDATPSTSICGMTILHPPDLAPLAGNLASLPRIPRDEGGPIFAGPWQATAFALAVRLSAEGHFTWKEWAAVLADELKLAVDRGEPDDGSQYYHHWLTALERLVITKTLSAPATLLARKEAWAEAYQRT